MSEELVVRQCAPTLAGIKTGSLFSCPCDSPEELRRKVRHINRLLAGRVCVCCPFALTAAVRCCTSTGPAACGRIWRMPRPCACWRRPGTHVTALGSAWPVSSAVCGRARIPHEIGLFLSYPPEDVRGFIENKACRFKCAGLWKVYGDEERAKELFRQYKRCTDRCCALWRAGSGLAQLAV